MEKKGNSLLLMLALGGAAIWYLSRKKDEENKKSAPSGSSSGSTNGFDPNDYDFEIDGCMDEEAFNYNPLATSDDGSCIDRVYGCMQEGNENYDPLANTDTDPTSCYVNLGCMDPTALNYDEAYNMSLPSSCEYEEEIVYGCTELGAANYDELATVNQTNADDPSSPCVFPGCTDPLAENWAPVANQDDGSCEYLDILGCTEPLACNYNENANVDNGSCQMPIPGRDCDGNCIDDIDQDGICDEEEVFGCTDVTANNTDYDATQDDGSCTYDILGCMDETATNYDATATINNYSCEYPVVEGCTAPTALNYNPDATDDDGSCINAIYGCMDSDATNYNSDANVDVPESCQFEEEGGYAYPGWTEQDTAVFEYMIVKYLQDNDSLEDLWKYVAPAYGGGALNPFWNPLSTNAVPPSVPPSEWDSSLCYINAPIFCIIPDWDYWTNAYLNN